MEKTLPYNRVEAGLRRFCTNFPDSAVMPEQEPGTASREFLLSGLQHRELGYGTCENVAVRDMDEIVTETLRLNHGQVTGMMPMERYLSEVGHWTPFCMGDKRIPKVAIETAQLPVRPSGDVDVHGRGER